MAMGKEELKRKGVFPERKANSFFRLRSASIFGKGPLY